MTAPHGALAGLRVLDLTQMLAGPFCTQLLADHGAEVIKIEPPAGDTTRKSGPFRADDRERAYGGYFQSVNRNKRSLVLDLKKEGAREVFLALAARADVVVENYRAGVMERLGLSYETMREINPRLVYAAIRGFGDPRSGASPYVDWPAYDVVAQAMGGMMGITGTGPGQPMKIGPGVGDLVPAVLAAFGVLAAVHHAQRTGEGQFVDVAMTDAVLALCERIVYQHAYTGEVPGPEGNRHPLLCPFGLFAASDGAVAIACPGDGFWATLAEAIGRPEMALDPAYATNAARVANAHAVIQAVEAFTRQHSKQELSALLGGRVPFGPVYDAQDILDDPHFRARGMLVELEQPGSTAPVRVAGIPVKLSDTPGAVTRRAPRLGEHSDAILRELGWQADTIARLREEGAIA
ncbi:MAG: CaiB/BaiF CoA transferase family protein [Cupriavidus necator]